jgi:hypothetical protein
MSDILIKNPYQLLKSVDETPYFNDSNAIINPSSEEIEQYNPNNNIDILKVKKKAEVKDAARIIILSRYPTWKQNNMSGRAIELVDKGELTIEEEAEKNNIRSAWEWIKGIRQQSDLKENDIESKSLEELKEYKIEFNEEV